jgi:hypothetical protein
MKPICCIVLSCIFLASCNAPRYVYSPSDTNTPMFSGGGEANAVAGISSNGLGNGAGINLAANYSPVNHAGLGIQYYNTSDNNKGADIQVRGVVHNASLKYKRQMMQAQAFAYTHLGETGNFFAEMGFGYGSGRYRINDTQSDSGGTNQVNYFHQAKAKHATIHAAFYSVWGKKAPTRMGVSLRLNNVKFHDVNTSYDRFQLASYRLDSLTFAPISFLEPVFSFNIGMRDIPGFEITGQMGFSAKMNGPQIDHRGLHFSFGFGYRLNSKRKHTDKAPPKE